MGLHDTEEMLEAAKADAILMERQIADLQDRLDAIRALADEAVRDAALPALIPSVGLVRAEPILEILDRPPAEVHGVFLRDHDAHEIAQVLRVGQGDEPLSAHGEDVVGRLEQA